MSTSTRRFSRGGLLEGQLLGAVPEWDEALLKTWAIGVGWKCLGQFQGRIQVVSCKFGTQKVLLSFAMLHLPPNH